MTTVEIVIQKLALTAVRRARTGDVDGARAYARAAASMWMSWQRKRAN